MTCPECDSDNVEKTDKGWKCNECGEEFTEEDVAYAYFYTTP